MRKPSLILAVVLIFVLSACGSLVAAPERGSLVNEPKEEVEAPADTPVPPTATSAPSDTAPASLKEGALLKWRAPFISAAFAYTLCMQVSETQEGVGGPVNFIMILGMAAGTLEEWQPGPDQVELEKRLDATIQEFNQIFQDNSPATLPAGAAEICPAFLTIINDIRGAARADGLTDKDLQEVIREVQESLEQVK